MFSVLLLATGFINQVGCNTLPIVTYAVDGEAASSTFERLKGEKAMPIAACALGVIGAANAEHEPRLQAASIDI